MRLNQLGRPVLAIGAALMLVLAACADDTEPGAGDMETTTIGVTLQEWSVIPEESEAGAGEISFEVSNDGAEVHEFMVVRSGLALSELPTNEDGSLDEDGEDVEIVDATNAAAHEGEEHEEIEAGGAKDFSYDLDQDSYYLVCNLIDTEDGETESHFALGMRLPFTVE